jgi:transcriptional regulator with PAS, ATPase and Fis domain
MVIEYKRSAMEEEKNSEVLQIIENLRKEVEAYKQVLREGYNGILSDLKANALLIDKWNKVIGTLQAQAQMKEYADARAEGRPPKEFTKAYFGDAANYHAWYQFGKAVAFADARIEILMELRDYINSEPVFIKSVERIHKERKRKKLQEQLKDSKELLCQEQ